MTVLLNTLVPASIYNSLPHIHEVSKAPDDHDKDLEHLRGLLAKHKTPKEVAIRLIHKHFDTRENEVMVFDKMSVPGHGMVQTMRPMQADNSIMLRGIHYFVDQAGNLQAFEYSNGDAPDVASIQPFLDEFARSVAERRLQHKFGLKLNFDEDLENRSWNEFEFPQQRSTIMLQDGMPMPAGDFDCEVNTASTASTARGTTEWTATPRTALVVIFSWRDRKSSLAHQSTILSKPSSWRLTN